MCRLADELLTELSRRECELPLYSEDESFREFEDVYSEGIWPPPSEECSVENPCVECLWAEKESKNERIS